jgi:dienelactone hydrolase
VAEADKRGIGDSTKKTAVGFCFGGGNILEHDFIQDAFNKKL